MIGGSGPKKTLRTVALYGDGWNTSGDLETVAERSRILDEHCAVVGRDPASIERTVSFPMVLRDDRAAAEAVLEGPAGAQRTRRDQRHAAGARIAGSRCRPHPAVPRPRVLDGHRPPARRRSTPRRSRASASSAKTSGRWSRELLLGPRWARTVDRGAAFSRVVALAGGVGGAKLAAGLQAVVGADLTVIVNTGDDLELHGLLVCPDHDTVLYTLAGLGRSRTGLGPGGRILERRRRSSSASASRPGSGSATATWPRTSCERRDCARAPA